MARIYKNPPIIQAICEYSLEPTQSWDWTVPGLLYNQVKDSFPKKRERNILQVEFQGGANVIPPAVKGGIARVEFLTEDEKTLIQVGPDLVAAHRLRPYTGWASFRPIILRAFDAYANIAKPRGIRRIGLRFINRIEMSREEDVRIEDYLLAVPRVPTEIPQTFGTWAQRVEIPFRSIEAVLILQSGSVRGGDGKIAFMLDLDFVTAAPESLPLEDNERRLEAAHAEVEKAFEACVTDEARKLFGEVLS